MHDDHKPGAKAQRDKAHADDDATALTGKGGAGESGGGAYPNPHTGKQKDDASHGSFDGGQTERRYFGPEDAAANSAEGAQRDHLAGKSDSE